MANKRNVSKKSCTSHQVLLCPANKYIVNVIKTQILVKKDTCNVDDAVNKIISEYGELKNIKVPA